MTAHGSARDRRMGRRAGLKRAAREEAVFGWLLASPWILGFLIFTAGPMLVSAYLSLTSWDGYTSIELIGLRNYVYAFTGDDLFWKSLSVTVNYAAVSLPLSLAIALALAMLLNQEVSGQRVFRTVFYLPSVLPAVAVGILWSLVLNKDLGLVNYTLWKLLRIEGPNWLGSRQWALWSVIVLSLWNVGRPMVIFLAGLRGIPQELYEAAALDGANDTQKFRFVTLPVLSPIIFFNLIVGVIGSFQVFSIAYVMTEGGPQYSTMFYMLMLYRNAFQFYKMGYASAQAWILFIIIVGLTAIQFKLAGRWVYTGDIRL